MVTLSERTNTSTEVKKPIRFAMVLLFTCMVGLVCVAAVNVVVNPYLMFNMAVNHAVFEKKPEAATRVRIFKQYQAQNQAYEVLIVGNSRVEMGLDPRSDYFQQRRVYNAGVPGLSLQSQLSYAQHIMLSNPVEEVLIGIDFVDFLTHANTTFKANALAPDPLKDYMSAALSLDALKSSIFTMLNQGPYASSRTYNGFNPAQDYVPILRAEGQDVITSQKLRSLAKRVQGNRFDIALMQNHALSPLNTLKASIQSWQSKGIMVSVFINPYQESYYAELDKAALLASFESWKTLLQSELKTLDAELPFYDFTDLGRKYSSTLGENGELEYFWEPAHYKSELGERLLARIYAEQ